MREAHRRAGEGSAVGVIQARLAELAGPYACACAMHADFFGSVEVLTDEVATAVEARDTFLCATFLRLHGHRDAVIRDAVGAVEVRCARSAFVALDASFAQDAALTFEQRVVFSKVAGRDARCVDGRAAAEVAVALLGHAVAELAGITNRSAIVAAGAIGIAVAIGLGAIRVGVSVAFRDARQVGGAFLCGARKRRACRSIGTCADVAVCLGETCLFVELARIRRTTALRRIATLAGRAAGVHLAAFITERTFQSNPKALAVGLTRHRCATRVVFFRRRTILRSVVETVAV